LTVVDVSGSRTLDLWRMILCRPSTIII